MAVHVCGQVIQAVCQCQGLRISQALTHFFNAPVDVSAIDVYFFHDFAFQGYPETQYPVSGRVLRSDVYDIFVVFKNGMHLLFQFPGFGQFYRRDNVFIDFAFQTDGVDFRVSVVVFPERIAHPVVAQEQSAHVGVVDEPDAEETEYLAFIEISRCPHVRHAGQLRILAVCRFLAQDDFMLQGGGAQVVYHAQRFAPIHAGHADQIVKL